MARLDGNGILIVDPRPGMASGLAASLANFGALSASATSFQEARSLLIERDFDLIICSQELPDGSIIALSRWCREHLLLYPRLGLISDDGKVDSQVQVECDLCGVVDPHRSESVLEEVAKFLFNFDDFMNCLMSMSDTSLIHYEIHSGSFQHLMRPLEMSPQGLFYSTDGEISYGHVGFLKIYFFEGTVAKTFTIAGYPERTSKGQEFFGIHPHYRLLWKRVMKRLDQKQVDISAFLKKAAGW